MLDFVSNDALPVLADEQESDDEVGKGAVDVGGDEDFEAPRTTDALVVGHGAFYSRLMPQPFPQLPPGQRGEVRWLRHDSKILAGNHWRDPTERDVIVYTPPNWEGDPVPAVMCLIGFSGTGEKLLNRGMNTVSIANRIDRLIADGCPPFAAVLPDCMTTLGGSQYLDSIGIGNYATYVAQELRNFVSNELGVGVRWGVMGHSSGGFGALHLAMNHPGAFAAAACHAGDMGFDLCYIGDLGKAVRGVAKSGGLEGFLNEFWASNNPGGAAFAAINVLAMAAAYSPNPTASPFPADLPVDFETGEVDFGVLQSWSRFDPIHQVGEPAKAAALRALDLLYIDVGNRDEYNLHYGARRFVKKLDLAQIEHVYEEFPGGHGGSRHRFNRSLRLLADALTR